MGESAASTLLGLLQPLHISGDHRCFCQKLALQRRCPARTPLGSEPGEGGSGTAAVAQAVPRARARDPYLKPPLASAGPLPCPRSRPPARPPPLPAAARRQPPGQRRRRGGASGRTASAGGSGSALPARLELARDPAPDWPPAPSGVPSLSGSEPVARSSLLSYSQEFPAGEERILS